MLYCRYGKAIEPKAATNIDVMIQQKEKGYECFGIGINSRE